MICCDCGGNGWGPMLTTETWEKVEPSFETPYKLASQPNLQRWGKFLCEDCVSRRLDRPLNGDDLRDCPMNYMHPAYKPHGRM
jgi:predicted phage-related endonuclease